MNAQPESRSPLERALRQLIDSRDNVERLEVRLEVMLSRWAHLEDQHARALADLERAAGRLQELESRLQQQMQLPHEAAVPGGPLGETISAIRSLIERFQRIEAHLASRETQLAQWMAEARTDLHRVGATPRAGAPLLSSVVDERADGRRSWASWIALAALAAAIVVLFWVLQLRGQLREADSGVQAAARQTRVIIEDQVARQLVEMRTVTARESAALRAEITKTALMAGVLAAPDLVRFNLAGTVMAPRARGEGLWSRSRGFVFTASGLPPPPGGSMYVLWFVTPNGRAPLETAPIDALGRLTVATDAAPNAPGPIVGLILTAETGRVTGLPAGPVYLINRQPG